MKALLSFVLLFAPGLALAGSVDKASPIGKSIDNFNLRDFRGADKALQDFAKAKLVVVVFMGTECPVAKLYGPRLTESPKSTGPREWHSSASMPTCKILQQLSANMPRPRQSRFPFSKTSAMSSRIALAPFGLPKCLSSIAPGSSAIGVESTTSTALATRGRRPNTASWPAPLTSCSRVSP